MLDDILKGVNELHDIAKAIKTQIDIGSAMMDDLGNKLDKTNETLKKSNARLQEILEESGGVTRWCPMIICVIILLACVGFLYSQGFT